MRWKITGAALATLVVVIGALDLHQHYDVPSSVALPLAVLRVLPWALLLPSGNVVRDGRAAWGAWAVTLAATYAAAAAGQPVGPSEPWPWAVTSILAALPVAVVCGGRLSRPVLAAFAASVPVTGAVALLVAGGGWTDLVAPTVLLATALAAGDLVRGRREARAEVAVEQDRREALEERARIAREMHDVVAHGLALVTVRADSAPARLGGVSPAAEAEFAGIADAARGTLAELRGLLEVLRGPGGELAPQPTLADLPALADSSRAAGVAVRLTVEGDGSDLPPGVQLTAYRLVQEALSNVLRHAPGAPADVSVSRTGAGLHLAVTNPGAPGPPGRGHGLVGMRERVAAVGGTLTAGPEPGGWRVDATLPA